MPAVRVHENINKPRLVKGNRREQRLDHHIARRKRTIARFTFVMQMPRAVL